MGNNRDPGTQLVQCPNYSVCQTMVHAVKRGLEHQYGVWDPNKGKNGEMVYKTCSGG